MEKIIFYVSPKGDDALDGLSPDKNGTSGPFRTLYHARNAVRALKSRGQVPVTVYIRGGRYELNHPLTLLTQDGGSSNAPVVWAAYPGETPILSGGRTITGWKPFRDGIYVADLPEAQDGYFTRQLFYRGIRMTRARYPKVDPANPRSTGWLRVDKAAFIHPEDETGEIASAEWKLFYEEDFSQAFHYREGDLPHKYNDLKQMEVVVSPMLGWFNIMLPIRELDTDRRVIAFGRPLPNYHRLPWTNGVVFSKNNRYYMTNALEDLTEPGEWVLDRRNGKVYFKPPEGISDSDVVMPVTSCLIDLCGTSHVTVEGLTFTETLDAGEDWHREGMNGYGAMFNHQGNSYCGETLHIYDSSFCNIKNNRFIYCGNNAIYVDSDCVRNCIEHNEIAYSGANAITLIGNEIRHPRNNRVTDNHIHHCGEILNYIAGVFLGCSDGTTVSHNRIHDMPHHAINLATNGFGRNLIEYNDIRRVTLEINDTGAINCWMDDPGEGHPMLPRVARSGHIIRYNWISDIYGMQVDEHGNVTTTDATRGIYLDDGASNCMVYGNCIVRCFCGMLLHCGMHNYVENNLFIDCEIGINIGDGVSPRVGNEAMIGFQRGHHFERNVFFTRVKNPVLYTMHKYSHTLLHHCDSNLLYSAEPYRIMWSWITDPDKFKTDDLEGWRSQGFDLDSLITDPLFEDVEKDDYRLRSDSPLLALGFVPIPFDRIGPR